MDLEVWLGAGQTRVRHATLSNPPTVLVSLLASTKYPFLIENHSVVSCRSRMSVLEGRRREGASMESFNGARDQDKAVSRSEVAMLC